MSRDNVTCVVCDPEALLQLTRQIFLREDRPAPNQLQDLALPKSLVHSLPLVQARFGFFQRRGDRRRSRAAGQLARFHALRGIEQRGHLGREFRREGGQSRGASSPTVSCLA